MNRSKRSIQRETARGKAASGGSSQRLRGYTLLELLLVVGILMICAGAVAPSVMGVLASFHLKEGVEKVQKALGETRVHAIDATSTYQFRFEPGGRHFLAVPTDDDALNSPGPAVSADGKSLTPGMFEAGLLPETLSFQVSTSSGAAPESPAPPAASDPGWIGGIGRMPDAHDFASVAWSDPISFRPDGTGTDATFQIVDMRGAAYRFTIREVTGEIFIHPVTTEPH
jgi:type II secretory pathway pseudopilin PulG